MTSTSRPRRDLVVRLLASCVVSIVLAAAVAGGCGDAGEPGRSVHCYPWVGAAAGTALPLAGDLVRPRRGGPSCGVTQTIDFCCYDVGGCVFGGPPAGAAEADRDMRVACLSEPGR